jgi:hypothetical protein
MRNLTNEEISIVTGGEMDACGAVGAVSIGLGAIALVAGIAAAPVTGGASLALWAVAVGAGTASLGTGAASVACDAVT